MINYTKIGVPELYKRSSEYDSLIDMTSMTLSFSDILDPLIIEARDAYDDLIFESFSACGIDRDTLMKNKNKVVIYSMVDSHLGNTHTYDKIFYDGKPLFIITKDFFSFPELKITLKVEFI